MHDDRRRGRRTCDTSTSRDNEKCLALVKALNDRKCVWRVIRADPRIKIMVCLTALEANLSAYAPPISDDPEQARWVEILLYITRPRSMNLPQESFHVVFIVNRSRAYAAVADLNLIPTLGDDSPDAIFFEDVDPLDPPTNMPDPSTEDFPSFPHADVDLDAIAERAKPPSDPYNCLALSVGAWWSPSQRRIYYLRMETSLLALCPAGWRDRSLGATLARLLNHEHGCWECRRQHEHIDAYNAIRIPGSLGLSCLCFGPCMWSKARQRDLSVQGDPSICQVLFLDNVDAVRITETTNGPSITGSLGAVIGPGGSARRVPVNATGWHLAALPETWSMAMIRGCSRLSRLCSPSTAADVGHVD
ncbi:tegument protein UL16 [Columbid alphaherpesvirus 1]|uniref:Tegument protein UL16 n=1 Tax=Columbid alphaherpesvirus 1 TaxID=93386 RepID=A0A1V0M8F0_9ALPH|nr:tegument protein UL16 [Columbid alphaherpesvirus 1]ARD71338.1 tegument protein UL16 [Columbid alphaherpesvirus 1]